MGKPISEKQFPEGLSRAPGLTTEGMPNPTKTETPAAKSAELIAMAQASADPTKAEREKYLSELRPIHLEMAKLRLAKLRAEVNERQIRVAERAERAEQARAAEGQVGATVTEQRRMGRANARFWDRVALWLVGAVLVFIFFLPVISPGCFAQLTHH